MAALDLSTLSAPPGAAEPASVHAPAPLISIVIPTFRRAVALRRALASCTVQVPVPDAEIVVVDNCPHGSARELVNVFASSSSLPVRYVHERTAGVAAARDAGVATARGTFIAFLDDDEEAAPQWLAELLRAQAQLQADVVFGPVVARAEPGAGEETDAGVLEEALRIFGRSFPEGTGPMKPSRHALLGTGNSLFRRELLAGRRFDPSLGLTGGEDSAMLKPLILEGRSIAWSREAVVSEYVPEQRLTLRSIMSRRFSAGQGRTATCALTEPRQPVKAAQWMVIGAAQAVLSAGAAAAAVVVKPSRAAAYAASAAAGAGKVLWMWPFRIRRYPTLEERLR